MKKTKLIIAAVLVLLTPATFAQIDRGLYATVEYSSEKNRFETWISQIGDRISHLGFENSSQPVISKTYYTDYALISYDDEASFEQWMATPFEEAIFEKGPDLEEWMSRSFMAEASEEDLHLEEWMSQPFETGEMIQAENWITASNQ